MKYEIHKHPVQDNILKVEVSVVLRRKLKEKKEYFTTDDLTAILISEGFEIESLLSFSNTVLSNSASAGHKQDGVWLFELKKPKAAPRRKRQNRKTTQSKSVRSRMKKLAKEIKESKEED